MSIRTTYLKILVEALRILVDSVMNFQSKPLKSTYSTGNHYTLTALVHHISMFDLFFNEIGKDTSNTCCTVVKLGEYFTCISLVNLQFVKSIVVMVFLFLFNVRNILKNVLI